MAEHRFSIAGLPDGMMPRVQESGGATETAPHRANDAQREQRLERLGALAVAGQCSVCKTQPICRLPVSL